jgi:hypothetical protein
VVNTGTGNEVVLDFSIPQGFTGSVGATGASGGGGAKGDTGEKGDKGDKGDTGSAGSAGIVDAVALAIAVSSHITSMSLPTATDFTDMGSDITTLTNNKVSKPSDWSIQSQYPETELNPYTLDDYVYEKVRWNNKLDKATVLDIGKSGDSTHVNFNAKHTKINADDVNIGASVVPAGYKLIVEGDTKIQNGTSKYLDLYNNKVGIRTDADIIDTGCDVKIVGSTCIEGDLKVSGVLKNGNDEPYITQQDHDDDLTILTDIMTDFQNAIQTNTDGTDTIPDGAKLAYTSQLAPLQTTIDTLESTKTTIENVDNLIDARILSEGLVDETFLGQNHYTKSDTDALIPDISNFETSTQLDTRLADYTTINLFEAHENLMELELAGKADTTAIPDVSAFLTSADLPDTTGFALSSAIPDVSGFITNSTSGLQNYYNKTETDTLIPEGLDWKSSHILLNEPVDTIRGFEIGALRGVPDIEFTIPNRSNGTFIKYTKEGLTTTFFNAIHSALHTHALTHNYYYVFKDVYRTGNNYHFEVVMPSKYYNGGGLGYQDVFTFKMENVYYSEIGSTPANPLHNYFGDGRGEDMYYFDCLSEPYAVNTTLATYRLTLPATTFTNNGAEDEIWDKAGNCFKYGGRNKLVLSAEQGTSDNYSSRLVATNHGSIYRKYYVPGRPSNFSGAGFHLTGSAVMPLTGDSDNSYGHLNVDLGTPSYQWNKLYYNGGVLGSDDRLKHNEEEVVDALGTIKKLKLLKYDKTSKILDADFNGELGDIPHWKEMGFIAQSVNEIPELAFLVSVPGDPEEEIEPGLKRGVETYGLDYQGINNLLVQAVQELSAKNDALEARLLALEDKINVM